MTLTPETIGEHGVGYFLFSLDTELAWGYFDSGKKRAQLLSRDGGRERWAIERILELFGQFNIVGTWAVVGHLFYPKCEDCEECPIEKWEGRFSSYEQIFETDHPLWYGSDVIDAVRAAKPRQEIAFHGYTHEVFDESQMSSERAHFEIREWMRLAGRRGIVPKSVVFPRNRIGHMSLFQSAGFICYRSEEYVPLHLRARYVGPLLKTFAQVLSLYDPPIYGLADVGSGGLLNLPSSQHLFDFDRRVESLLDGMNLHLLRLRGFKRGIRKAAKRAKIFHLWAHPWELKSEKDIDKLRYVLGFVAEESEKGRMCSVGMAEIAEEVLGASPVAGRVTYPSKTKAGFGVYDVDRNGSVGGDSLARGIARKGD
jgi:hypothetical protein